MPGNVTIYSPVSRALTKAELAALAAGAEIGVASDGARATVRWPNLTMTINLRPGRTSRPSPPVRD